MILWDLVKFYEILWDFGWFYEFYEVWEACIVAVQPSMELIPIKKECSIAVFSAEKNVVGLHSTNYSFEPDICILCTLWGDWDQKDFLIVVNAVQQSEACNFSSDS